MSKKLRAVGTYIYAGGFSLGVKEHANVLAHMEDPKPYGEEVIGLNRAGVWGKMPVHPLPLDGSLWPEYDNLDLVFGNPPCALFSNNNQKSFIKDSWKEDPRLDCWHNIMKYISKTEPKVFAWETVPQAYTKAPELIKQVHEWATSIGYGVTLFFHNAAFFGSCQNRRRLLIMGSKHQIQFEPFFSVPMIFISDKLDGDFDTSFILHESNKTDAIKYCSQGERLVKAWERMKGIKTNEDLKQLPKNKNGTIKDRPSFNVFRPSWHDLAPTLCGKPLIHPIEDRFLYFSEFQAVADYPPYYLFPQATRSIDYMCRGVSSHVGQWLGKTTKNTIKKNVKNKHNNMVIIDSLRRGFLGQETYIVSSNDELPKLKVNVKPDKGYKS